MDAVQDIAGAGEPLVDAVTVVAPAQQAAVPYAFARDNGALVEDIEGERVNVALREGGNALALLEIRSTFGLPLQVRRVASAEFEKLLADAYAMDGAAAAVAGDMGIAGEGLDPLALGLPTAEDLLDSADDAPAIRLINGLIAESLRQGVSDIHIEPYETALVVRMRFDGVLTEKLRMPPHVAPVLVSRIKVMARLDIAERRVPQDGRISLSLGGKLVDVRVSTLPNRAGERVVMRLLDKENAGIDLVQLGLDPKAEDTLRRALAEPNGIVLVTGPTGSGKTTTLYAALRGLNDGQRNILTVEDPVEYAVDG
ncbi:MAG: GspE/PulE family protein, partial [Novosphingobium sp.]